MAAKKQPTSAQNHPKIYPKSFQNRFRTAQNRSKIVPRRTKILTETPRLLENPAPPTGSLHFCQKCGQHGRNLGSQNEPKSLKNQSKNRSNFELLLGSSLDTKIGPKTTPKVIKNRSKIDLKSDHCTKTRTLVLTHKSKWFLHIFHSPDGPNSIKHQSKISSKGDQKTDPQKDRF